MKVRIYERKESGVLERHQIAEMEEATVRSEYRYAAKRLSWLRKTSARAASLAAYL